MNILPGLLIAGGVGTIVGFFLGTKEKPHTTAAATPAALPAATPAANAPAAGFGSPYMTPQREAIFGHLMRNETNPNKVQKAANLFGAEGLTEHAQALFGKAADLPKQAQGAAELVERSRAGDQHAMAIIDQIREACQAGSAKACTSYKLIEQYILAHPQPNAQPDAQAGFGGHNRPHAQPQQQQTANDGNGDGGDGSSIPAPPPPSSGVDYTTGKRMRVSSI